MSVAIAMQPEPSGTAAAFLKKKPRLLIGGEWVDSKSGKTVPVLDPVQPHHTVACVRAREMMPAVTVER